MYVVLFEQRATYKAGNLVANKAGHLVAYKANQIYRLTLSESFKKSSEKFNQKRRENLFK